ncbi:hypothetical protein M427DRAFT_35636 [Gonapodya prolifera JEL478]|uniref:Uncharacterized protein n=1 Tax=Gonapodya prolifera (strain JEL478) TaxID=1344416 RepID=A0A139A3U9_GONPJ|nr:hypothetical protein M427DRAFT_35636 [Gonapodya prolifera JEL478]|eukprot:KXS11496.1 hypothetical protein M427DRAFT_35636 [Gonapodya prolifera JEL478]
MHSHLSNGSRRRTAPSNSASTSSRISSSSSQKKLAPKPGGKAKPSAPAPTPATASTTASTPPAPTAHMHVIDAETPPALPMKRATPKDEGGCQNGKKFKGNSNNNNQKQDFRPRDCNRSPPCGKHCGLDNHTAWSHKYSGYTAAWIKALTERGQASRPSG